MIIKKLELHNFGVYAGDNRFLFEGNKPIVLVGGMNGRGKTTFLEAVLLALYGSNSFAYSESKYRSYLQYLRSFVNRNAVDKECSVELQFEIENGIKENYVVKRKWDILTKKTKEEIFVYKDGEFNEFLTNNWPMFVENILPSALSSFFFFDGEKIAEMAVDSTNVQLKNAIRSMLGINVLDVLENDILRNLKKVSKQDANSKTSEELEALRSEKDHAAFELEQITTKLENTTDILEKHNNELESLHQLYTAKGGDAVEKKQETIQKRAKLKSELEAEENRANEIASNELPLALVADLIQDIKLQAVDEHTEAIMQEAILQFNMLLEDFSAIYDGDIKASIDFIDFVKEQTQNNQEEPIYELSDHALLQVNSLNEGTLDNSCAEMKAIFNKKKLLVKQIAELDSYLTLDINDKELQRIYKKIKQVEEKIIQDKVVISDFEQKHVQATSKLNSATSEFNKYVESYLSTAELRDNVDRTVKYSNMALKIIEKYQVALQKKKADVLSETITKCYKQLANKKNLINKIEMDAETLNVKYLSENNHEVPKESLSAGEQQLIVISILWALAICSKKKLPVIIDTPLSRLDSLHRTALITTYFPNAGEQTIILSTDSEIDANYYELMKENVGDEFTLEYDEISKSTSIKRGYLMGANV